jgi:acetyl-CoA C-acetyltransferase
MSELTDAVICEPLRTPVGRYGGVFRNVPAEQLSQRGLEGVAEVAARTRRDAGAALGRSCRWRRERDGCAAPSGA